NIDKGAIVAHDAAIHRNLSSLDELAHVTPASGWKFALKDLIQRGRGSPAEYEPFGLEFHALERRVAHPLSPLHRRMAKVRPRSSVLALDRHEARQRRALANAGRPDTAAARLQKPEHAGRLR